MDITRELFDEQRHRRFGEANPQRMNMFYWEWMVRKGHDPYQVRKHLGIESDQPTEPDWCFDRMGATRTGLDDGRVVSIAGEHEDWYDPDFCIYNDVIILGPNDEIEIYGYPKDVFPPTDFHSATLVRGKIIIIGCLGYQSERVPDATPVYSLDLTSYRIDPIETKGELPGWVFNHEAVFDPVQAAITIGGGETIEKRDDEEVIRKIVEVYQLHLDVGRWERLTDRRSWRQFLISRQDRRFWFDHVQFFGEEVFRSKRVVYVPLPKLDWRTSRISVEGVCVNLSEEHNKVRILIEGELPESIVKRLVEDILANVEEVVRQPCRVLEI